MSVLREKKEALLSKQKGLAALFEEAGPELDFGKITSISGDSATKAAEIQRQNKELEELAAEVKQLGEVERIAAQTKQLGDTLNAIAPLPHPTGGAAKAEQKSIGELFIAQKGHIRNGGAGPLVRIDHEVKTLMQTAAGWEPEVLRTNRVELTPARQLVVTDLPMMSETSQAAVKYMRETTYVNEATEVVEGGAYPEAELALTEQDVPVRKIAVFLPVTDEQLEDEARTRDYVNNRLSRMIRERLDEQILNGDGIAPNLGGILATAGIQTQALGADVVLDTIYKGIIKVQHTGQANADAVVLHPNDWQAIRLTRTTDGLYIWGNPSARGPMTVWGLPVVVTSAITEGTGLVGAFRDYSELAVRRGIDVQATNSHDGYFKQGIIAIRADIRLALVVYRPTAFCSLTGI